MLKVSENSEGLVEFRMHTHIQGNINFEWADIRKLIMNKWAKNKIVVFLDSNVYEKDPTWTELENKHSSLNIFITNLDESSKESQSLFACLKRLESIGFSRRDDILLAIGGGVLMDLVSLAANLYRRGVPVIKVPTTLLGFVDASVGIKTGINFEGQRNRLGSYYLNYDVIYDRSFLRTLSPDLIKEGLGEIFKIAIIKSSRIFEILENNATEVLTPEFYQTESGLELLSLSIQMMLEELHENPTEGILKRCVDFGHNFSPLIEMESIQNKDYCNIPHGLAVAADCIITCIIARNRGLFSPHNFKRVVALGIKLGFTTHHPIYERVDIMCSSFLEMTRHRAGDQNLPYPTAIGQYDFIQNLIGEEIIVAANEFRLIGR